LSALEVARLGLIGGRGGDQEVDQVVELGDGGLVGGDGEVRGQRRRRGPGAGRFRVGGGRLGLGCGLRGRGRSRVVGRRGALGGGERPLLEGDVGRGLRVCALRALLVAGPVV